MTHFVLGTAGHIDHGKSALVKALTGRDPDRLKEEKDRGITIELGFADLQLDDGLTLSIVDVPGHERFVRHMVAGASGIDAVLLVIAADQGVEPQTREHLDICTLLGIEHGIVVLSKSDLVDPDLLEVVHLEVREFLTGSFLENAPIVTASARTGDGLERVRQEVRALSAHLVDRDKGGIARLGVDRSFVLQGFGTVVTGTLVSGVLREGQEVEVLPGGRKGRVRGLQVHWSKVREASAGRRTAVNLQGLQCADVPRGSTVTAPGALRTTRRVWGRVRMLETAPRSMARGGPVRFHQGTCERAARFRVLGDASDGRTDIELFLDQETVLLPGDRFILRRPAPVDTVGGGVVLDIAPPRGRAARGERRLLEDTDPEEALLVRLARGGRSGCEPASLAGAMGWTSEKLERRASQLESDGRLVRAAGILFDASILAKLQEDLEAALAEFHAAEALKRGMSRERLRSRICPEMPHEPWRAFVRSLEEKDAVRADQELLALPGHRVVLSPGERATAESIEKRYREAGLDPPAVEDALAGVEREIGPRLLEYLEDSGRLVEIKDGRLFHADALYALYGKLRDHATRSKSIDVPAFKKLAGVTRKNAIPLLEFLDSERRTRRVGNVREILNMETGRRGPSRR